LLNKLYVVKKRNSYISNDNGSFTLYLDFFFFPLSLLKHLPDLTVYISNAADVL